MFELQSAFVFTASGATLDLLAPKPVDFRIEDIAHQLAMQPRYAGATRFPYSVAQHSALVARACPEHLRLWGLLHDAPEAYLGDLVSPMKRNLPQYVQAEGVLMRAICKRFGLTWPEPPEVKQHDLAVAELEMRCLLRGQRPGPSDCIPELTWRQARDEFLEIYEQHRLASAEILRLLEMCRWRMTDAADGHVAFQNPSGTRAVTLQHPARDVPGAVLQEIVDYLGLPLALTPRSGNGRT